MGRWGCQASGVLGHSGWWDGVTPSVQCPPTILVGDVLTRGRSSTGLPCVNLFFNCKFSRFLNRRSLQLRVLRRKDKTGLEKQTGRSTASVQFCSVVSGGGWVLEGEQGALQTLIRGPSHTHAALPQPSRVGAILGRAGSPGGEA